MEKWKSEEVTSKTRSDAGILLSSMQSFSFLCYLNLWESVPLKTHFMEQKDVLIQNAVISAQTICEELKISTERQARWRKN